MNTIEDLGRAVFGKEKDRLFVDESFVRKNLVSHNWKKRFVSLMALEKNFDLDDVELTSLVFRKR